MDAIGIAVQNLLENAGKYATPETEVTVELLETGALVVRNDCEAIAPTRLSELTRRFVRTSHNQPGSGIGLAIVATIAGHCNAQLQLRSPCFPNGRGFEATLAFKLSQADSANPPRE